MWSIADEYLPKTLTVSLIAAEITESFTQRYHASNAQRVQGVSILIDVAKKAGLKSSAHGDITVLSNATKCNRAFAKTVLHAIETGTEAISCAATCVPTLSKQHPGQTKYLVLF